MRKYASLNELRTVYNLRDLLDFHDAIAAFDKARDDDMGSEE
ncbi:hypothetical protein [Rahnella sp. ChDrAdgB13]|nr:hypothetical protein [Rahnella sp. ChDrAdgB13]